jgi:hypothetical protein
MSNAHTESSVVDLTRRGQRSLRPAPDDLLTRRQTAEALSAAGYPTSAATLTKKACRGGGPPYEIYGARAIYRWDLCLKWAQENKRPPRAKGASDQPRHLQESA